MNYIFRKMLSSSWVLLNVQKFLHRCITYFGRVEDYISAIRKDANGPRRQIIVHVIEHYSSSRFPVIVWQESCTLPCLWRVHICLQQQRIFNERQIIMNHGDKITDAYAYLYTCWRFPKDVIAGSAETMDFSHILTALWSSLRWPYFGCLIRPVEWKGSLKDFSLLVKRNWIMTYANFYTTKLFKRT